MTTGLSSSSSNLFVNGDFRQRSAGGKAIGYETTGAAAFGYPGDARAEVADWGAGLKSMEPSGAVSQTVDGIDIANGRWFRFTFRGLPESNFAVGDNNLYMRVEFFGTGGQTTYDAKARKIYPQVQEARQNLSVNGVGKRNGAASWQTYQLDFCLPFPQVHRLKLSVGFGNGAANRARGSDFYVTDFQLVHITDPPEGADVIAKKSSAVVPTYNRLLPLGGRWFYAAVAGESQPPAQFDGSNADRLLYHDAAYVAPFAGNTEAWLHKENVDLSGNVVTADRLVTDNLTISFDSNSLVMRTHGLPNHPTGVFPSQGFGDGNPNSIIEQIKTYHIPLNPSENPAHTVTTKNNSNHALPMGPIGIAVNGVVFFNPFDAGSRDATDLMDLCCGHPNPMGQYHYHKYPICVNSPWADEGKEHSPLIGFAFDGYPVYGPYESTDVMAKDVRGEHALNGFNMHYDQERGWHYHVTPGVFPYIIGGYWGTEDARDAQRGPRGGGGGNSGRRMGGVGGPPPGGPPPGGGGFPPPN